ncbi:MAG: hypothetical protein NC418_06280 [Muribaculaceae bacterium]|nr:hypothetical protein [Muribaculaceae bacterium]
MNGIIIDSKVYEAVPRGSRHCFDCDLREKCEASYGFCMELGVPRHIFRYSQSLTDKIKKLDR